MFNFKYINTWNLLFYSLIALQLGLGIFRDDDITGALWSCAVIWCIFLLGYNSLDRELEINLDKAKEKIKESK